MNQKDINLILFFNESIICFIINIYSNDQQNTLKYLKDIEVNLNNILIMTGDFNIRNNSWDPLYSYYSLYTDTLREIASSFNLELSTHINQVLMRYLDNLNNSNLVIDLIFLWVNSEEIDMHSILHDLQSLSDHTLLMVDITISKEFI